MALSLGATNYFWATIETVDTHNSYNVVNRDYLLYNKYQAVYPIVLNSIYTLTY